MTTGFADVENHNLIRDAVRSVCSKFPDEYWAEKDTAAEFPWEFFNAMADAGWIGIALPEEYGGGGLPPLARA
jgi:acyl-CoA dehydrogenase